MKKFILGIVVIAAVIISVPATAQANNDLNVNTEVVNDEFVPVDFQNLPEEAQEMLLKVFAGYDIKEVYQGVETKLLKVIVVKDDDKKIFVQNEEGEFIEQE